MNPLSNDNKVYVNEWKQLDEKDAQGRNQVSGDLVINGKTYTITLGYSKSLEDKLLNYKKITKFLENVIKDESKEIAQLIERNQSGFEFDITTNELDAEPQESEVSLKDEQDQAPVSKKAVHVVSTAATKDSETVKSDDRSTDTMSKTTTIFQKNVTERFKKWLTQQEEEDRKKLSKLTHDSYLVPKPKKVSSDY